MKLTIHGAARTVTGSMYLLEVNGRKILFECGFFQGKRKESHERNRFFPFVPSEIHCMLLSHTHIDHSGNIPNLVHQGFEGTIFCNHATRDLTSLMLEDSAHIQESDAAFINKRNQREGRKDEPLAEPLYTLREAQAAVRHFMSVGYDRAFDIMEGVTVTFHDAGHILGSSEIVFDLREGARRLRLVFSGDIGRGKSDLLRDPTPFEDVDVLILESTYGGRTHEPQETANDRLCAILNRALERKGKVIIPAFSVGRTQQLVHALHELTEKHSLARIPIYVDSPLSINATEIFRLHPECFNAATNEKLRNHENPFGLQTLTYIRSADESKALNDHPESCIIISASGMCEAGRVRHHLRNNIDDPKNTILMAGFCAPNTLGRALIEGQSHVNIHGEKHVVRAHVEVMDAFSAHADRNELLGLVERSTGPMRQILLTHGQLDQAEALAKSLQVKHPDSKILIPDLHESVEL
ncbi:MAG: MBL fold metallo-hydrolase [Verrucomicrobia bacterium]|nr:MBL fold metallo-hydrolase [Verrucomicrobiota bacterium]